MNRGWIVNVLLLAAVVGLGWYVLYRPAVDEVAQHKLTTLVPSTVSHVLIEPRGGDPIELTKRGEAWYLVRPFEARADRSQVDRLLELTSASSKEKLAATDLARFDLDRPAVAVTLGDQRFAFGTVNPLNQGQYVQAGDAVYLLPSFYASLVPQKPERLLTHALFVQGETPVAFVLPGFRVEQQGPKWTRVPAAPKEPPSQDEFNRWVEGWRFASSLLTQRAGPGAAKEHVDVRLSDGRTLKLDVLQKEPELILVRPDEKLQFFFSGEVAKRLMTPPEAAVPASDAATSAVPAADAATSAVPAQAR
jgi:hypothetical protein